MALDFINHKSNKAVLKEDQDRVPTLGWLPGLHKRPYKAGFVAGSGSCAAAELSGLLASCLAAVKTVPLYRTCYQLLWKGIWEIL